MQEPWTFITLQAYEAQILFLFTKAKDDFWFFLVSSDPGNGGGDGGDDGGGHVGGDGNGGGGGLEGGRIVLGRNHDEPLNWLFLTSHFSQLNCVACTL